MAHEKFSLSVKVTDELGDQAIFTPLGDGLIVNATSVDGEEKVDVQLDPHDLDAVLDLLSEEILSAALVRKAEGR